MAFSGPAVQFTQCTMSSILRQEQWRAIHSRHLSVRLLFPIAKRSSFAQLLTKISMASSSMPWHWQMFKLVNCVDWLAITRML
jgi:hypothetical protein